MSEYKDYGFQNDYLTHNFKYLLDPLLAMINKNQNQCILDLGCGNGYLANYLISLGYNVYGTDASERGIKIARQKNAGNFFVQDLSSDELPLELQGLKFDTIVTTEVIEHLYDPEGLLRFCRRHLTPGGALIISSPYHGYLKNLVLSILNKWDDHLNPLWHGGHIKLWSRHTLEKALKLHGFQPETFKGCGRLPYLWKSMLVKARLN